MLSKSTHNNYHTDMLSMQKEGPINSKPTKSCTNRSHQCFFPGKKIGKFLFSSVDLTNFAIFFVKFHQNFNVIYFYFYF